MSNKRTTLIGVGTLVVLAIVATSSLFHQALREDSNVTPIPPQPPETAPRFVDGCITLTGEQYLWKLYKAYTQGYLDSFMYVFDNAAEISQTDPDQISGLLARASYTSWTNYQERLVTIIPDKSGSNMVCTSTTSTNSPNVTP